VARGPLRAPQPCFVPLRNTPKPITCDPRRLRREAHPDPPVSHRAGARVDSGLLGFAIFGDATVARHSLWIRREGPNRQTRRESSRNLEEQCSTNSRRRNVYRASNVTNFFNNSKRQSDGRV